MKKQMITMTILASMVILTVSGCGIKKESDLDIKVTINTSAQESSNDSTEPVSANSTTEPASANSDIWWAQYDLGEKHLSEEYYDEAIIAFTKAIETDPEQAPAYVGRGDAYILSGYTEDNLTAAQTDYEEAMARDETNANAYLGLAEVNIARNEFDKASEILKQGINITDDDSLQTRLEEIDSGNINDCWGNTRKTSTYDDEGNIQYYIISDYKDGQEVYRTSYDAKGNQTGQVENQYDENGNLIQDYTYDAKSGTWVKKSDKNDKKDKSDNISKHTYYDPDGTNDGYVAYEYNESGDKIKETWYNSDGTIRLYYVFEYDESGNQIKDTSYDSEGIISLYYLYEYDESGNQVKCNSYEPDGTSYFDTVYEYDESGNCVKTINYEPDGTMNGYYVCKYDESGNEIDIKQYKPNGDMRWHDVYEYDESGNPVSITIYNSQGLISKYGVYEYSESGDWDKLTNYDEEGNMIGYEISEYDKSGN